VQLATPQKAHSVSSQSEKSTLHVFIERRDQNPSKECPIRLEVMDGESPLVEELYTKVAKEFGLRLSEFTLQVGETKLELMSEASLTELGLDLRKQSIILEARDTRR